MWVRIPLVRLVLLLFGGFVMVTVAERKRLRRSKKELINESAYRRFIDYSENDRPAIERRTLVINSNYQPITTCTVQKAIKKLFNENALIVLPPDESGGMWQELSWEDWGDIKPQEDESVLAAVCRVFKIPEIIKTTDFSDLPNRRVKLSRRAIHKRDDYTCQYCGKKAPTQIPVEELTIDHVVPKAQGGKTEWENVALACVNCNRIKDNKTPAQAKMPLKTRPRMPEYDILQGRLIRCDSWQHFLGDCYWEIPLKD